MTMIPSQATDLAYARAKLALDLAADTILGQNIAITYRGDATNTPEGVPVWARVSKLSVDGGVVTLGAPTRRNAEYGIVVIEFYGARTDASNFRKIESMADIVKTQFVSRSGGMRFTRQHVRSVPDENAYWRVNFQCDYSHEQAY